MYLETFGCQMNVLDSELVGGRLRAAGFRFTDDREQADVVLFNTCSVRQHAEDKVHARLGDMKPLKRRRPEVIVGVIGCMAEREGAGMFEAWPVVDLMCGPGELDKIPQLLDSAFTTRQSQAALQGNTARRSSTLDAAGDDLEMLDLSRSISPTDHNGSAYVRITRGCNKYCTYCVVPMTRGPEVHRPPDHVVAECARLAEAGVLEVTLLGQTVNHYRYDHGAAVSVNGTARPQIGPGAAAFTGRPSVGQRVTTFADLLKRIHDQVPAIRRLRFVTSFPRDFGDDILQVMAECPRICNYLHVPVQSGSNRILDMMNRGYTVEQYVDLIDRARDRLDDVQIASDFIVGFPTETADEFAASAELIRRCRFNNSFIFKYSPRPGTVGMQRFADDVPDAVKRRRNSELLAVQAEASQAVHEAFVGHTLDVLVEGVSEKARRRQDIVEFRISGQPHAGEPADESTVTQLSGRTTGDLIVMFDGPANLVGTIAPVRIHTAKPLTLFGNLLPQPAAV